MNEEIFPIVDIEGNVTGQATRSECHSGSKILHPVVHLHILDKDGYLYLQKRSDKKDIFPNLWDTAVGGHIDFGETPEKAVVRETREELNLSGLDIKYIGKHIIETPLERELTYCFYAITQQTPQPDMFEVSDGKFWSIPKIKANLKKGIFTPNFEQDFASFLSENLNKYILF
ncbi:NUDIX domain-containing protein [Dysgonomonas sp. 216]|uniref:NUDIX hydrolase n=1 Tax=Dysgonomonas sp. 216 TaxID=2302934 RepID=UPI0013D1D225|nr:NUDIX domain-containing protein [Dysgonomonas sp. 216]NDW18353.1 NUDIX domain-containing protein [Dysgonomonas sp. 216]NDW18721.1 NUDIX domain-containing protein [Dysgonomonas sp. 216]